VPVCGASVVLRGSPVSFLVFRPIAPRRAWQNTGKVLGPSRGNSLPHSRGKQAASAEWSVFRTYAVPRMVLRSGPQFYRSLESTQK